MSSGIPPVSTDLLDQERRHVEEIVGNAKIKRRTMRHKVKIMKLDPT